MVLVSSLLAHVQGNRRILGSIQSFIASAEIDDRFASVLNNFPPSITEKTKNVNLKQILDRCIPILSKWILRLSNLNTLDLTSRHPCRNDVLLFHESWRHLSKLTLDFCGFTRSGAVELSKVLASSTTIKELDLKYSEVYHHPGVIDPFQSYSVAEHAMQSSALTSISTNFGFNVCGRIGSITSIELDMMKYNAGYRYKPLLECEYNLMEQIRSFNCLKKIICVLFNSNCTKFKTPFTCFFSFTSASCSS